MTLFVLAFIFFTVEGPKPLMGVFQDKTTCQVVEGQMLTQAAGDASITGWAIPAECAAATEGKKT